MNFSALIVSTVLAMVCAATVSAQTIDSPIPPSPTPDTTTLDDITVLGAATTRQTESVYARTIGSGPPGRLSPRWNDRVCVRVMNMDAEHADILKARVQTVAQAIGLSPDASRTCSPNISIYASDDPDALADALIEAAPRNFRPVRNSVNLGDAALDAFRVSDAPVRWWQVSMPLMEDTGQPAIVLGATETRKQDPLGLAVTVRNGSRLRGNVRDDLIGVTIIIDTPKVNGVPFGAVSDYVAFVALAPADPRAETRSFNTVLNLFDRTDVSGLTLIDQDYLYALYTASRAPASAAIQASEIAGRMASERRRRSEIAN